MDMRKRIKGFIVIRKIEKRQITISYDLPFFYVYKLRATLWSPAFYNFSFYNLIVELHGLSLVALHFETCPDEWTYALGVVVADRL